MTTKIEYMFNDGCKPCQEMCNGLIPLRLLLKAQDIDIDFVKIEVAEDDAPKIVFSQDGVQISQLNGLPMAADPRLRALAVMLFVLRGIYDCSHDPKVQRLLDMGDEIYRSITG